MVNQSPAETALSRAMIRWSLAKATPVAETGSSWLYCVEQAGNQRAALKILKPEAANAAAGALLAWYAGEGAVTVFDTAEDAVFMEWVDGVTLGDPARSGRDAEATEAFGHLVAQLHRPRPQVPGGLTPLRQHFDLLFKSDARIWPQTARDLYARAIGIGLAMFDRPQAIIPLHGNLHHDSIIMSPRGWLAMTPKGLLGDPAYDLAQAFLSPAGALHLVTDATRVGRLADSFAARLGYNRKRLLGFAAAYAALTACRDIDQGKPINFQLAMLPLLLTAYNLA